MDKQQPSCETTRSIPDTPWVDGAVDTPIGPIPRAATSLTRADRRATRKVRWNIGRMKYTVPPGLYAIGNPTPSSDVFVTANFKMSFDHLRTNLAGVDGWILVLDTKGINVWCAAGKGTFGTDELVHRIETTRLAEVVSRKRIILPQLGAPGIKFHEVHERTGYHIVFGPVRADDLPAFLEARLQATPQMRRVRFTFYDRLVLVPVELTGWARYAGLAALIFLALAGLGPGGYSFARILPVGLNCIAALTIAYIAGVAITPVLLPWIPGHSFSLKGALVGLILAIGTVVVAGGSPGLFDNMFSGFAWLAIMTAVTSFLAMNFTGASTYTSLSGVRKEMRYAVPIQAAAASAGLVLWVTSRFV